MVLETAKIVRRMDDNDYALYMRTCRICNAICALSAEAAELQDDIANTNHRYYSGINGIVNSLSEVMKSAQEAVDEVYKSMLIEEHYNVDNRIRKDYEVNVSRV